MFIIIFDINYFVVTTSSTYYNLSAVIIVFSTVVTLLVIALTISNISWILYFIKYIKIKLFTITSNRHKISGTHNANNLNRSNEDIMMQVCEPYTLHQSKLTDDAVYAEYQ